MVIQTFWAWKCNTLRSWYFNTSLYYPTFQTNLQDFLFLFKRETWLFYILLLWTDPVTWLILCFMKWASGNKCEGGKYWEVGKHSISIILWKYCIFQTTHEHWKNKRTKRRWNMLADVSNVPSLQEKHYTLASWSGQIMGIHAHNHFDGLTLRLCTSYPAYPVRSEAPKC